MRTLLVTWMGCLLVLSGCRGRVEPREPAGPGTTSEYVFLADQSTMVQTGGFAGVHWTYHIRGRFQLRVNPEAGTAAFERVDAAATDDSSHRGTLDLNEVFGLTGLTGTVADGGKLVRFERKADKDSTGVSITLSLTDGTVTLQGQTTPPPNSADFFVFTLAAVAQRK